MLSKQISLKGNHYYYYFIIIFLLSTVYVHQTLLKSTMGLVDKLCFMQCSMEYIKRVLKNHKKFTFGILLDSTRDTLTDFFNAAREYGTDICC